MKIKKLAVIGALAGLVVAGVGVSLPAMAVPTLVTTYTASPTTVRSGESFTFYANGASTPDGSPGNWSFTGCYVYWINGVQFNNQLVGPFQPLVGTFLQTNTTGVNQTFQAAGYANETCVVGGVPATPATFDTGVLTTTPQVVVDPITLNVGQPITQPSFPYTSQALGGTTPFDWSSGGAFTEVSLSTCALGPAVFATNLPPGVTLDETYSPNGVAPSLILTGTPTTVGTYTACVQLDGDTAGDAYAYVTINVVNALPDTGVAPATAWTLGITGGVLALVGAALIVIRRRKAGQN